MNRTPAAIALAAALALPACGGPAPTANTAAAVDQPAEANAAEIDAALEQANAMDAQAEGSAPSNEEDAR